MGNGSSRDHARFPIRFWRIGSRLWRIGSRLRPCDSTGRKTAQRPTAALKPTRRLKKGGLWRNSSRPSNLTVIADTNTPREPFLYIDRHLPIRKHTIDATSEDDYGGTVRAPAVPIMALNRLRICCRLH